MMSKQHDDVMMRSSGHLNDIKTTLQYHDENHDDVMMRSPGRLDDNNTT